MNDFEKDLMFTIAVGETFLDVYPKIVRRRIYQPFDEETRKQQLKKCSCYVEFNLIYDRGTRLVL